MIAIVSWQFSFLLISLPTTCLIFLKRSLLPYGTTLLRSSPCCFSVNAVSVTGLERQDPVAQISAALCLLLFPVCGPSSPLRVAHSLPCTQYYSQSALAHAAFPARAFVASSFTYPYSGFNDGPFSHRKPRWPVQGTEFFDLCGADYLPWDLIVYVHAQVLSYFMYLLPFRHSCVPLMSRDQAMLCSRLSAQGQAVCYKLACSYPVV